MIGVLSKPRKHIFCESRNAEVLVKTLLKLDGDLFPFKVFLELKRRLPAPMSLDMLPFEN